MTAQILDQSFDQPKADAFAERLLNLFNGGALSLMILIGHRTRSSNGFMPLWWRIVARNRDRLQKVEREITDAKAFTCDVGDLDALLVALKDICSEMGNPSVLVHNAVSATFGTFLDADPEDLERNFRVNTTSLLYLARELTPAMIAAGNGAIIVTGNTAAWMPFLNSRINIEIKAILHRSHFYAKRWYLRIR